MIPTERPLDNPINWSFRVGRVRAIDVRVHIAFVLAAVVVVWMQSPVGSGESWRPWDVIAGGLSTYAILFALVLAHELGHCYGARRTGGEADEVLLWPLGGLAYVRPPHEPLAHAITAAAGPAVNVLVCAICSGVLTVWAGTLGAVPWNPMHPLLPADPTVLPTPGQVWLIRVFGISYFLLLINLLPIFPFDGGRLLQAWLWARRGYRTSIEIATGIGMVGAIAVGLLAIFAGEGWLLIMIAVFGYLTCWQTRRVVREGGDVDLGGLGFDRAGGYDGSGYASRPARRPGLLAARRARKAALRAERERSQLELRQRRVEEILRKISASGISSLTPHERQLLEGETQRRRAARAGLPESDGA